MKVAKTTTTISAPEVLAHLEKIGTQTEIDNLLRYGIVAKRPFGVPMGALLKLRKQLGMNHELSLKLWKSGRYEARLLAALLGDPDRVTKAQMNDWAKSFENWGDCDTACFKLFDQSPHAWAMAAKWATSQQEFVKRGGFALMACLALHDKNAPDAQFMPYLTHIEKGATDDRNFVKKAVLWAANGIGRRSAALNKSTIAMAKKLAASESASSKWIGKSAMRELTSAKVQTLVKRKK